MRELYDRFIAPRLIDAVCGMKLVSEQRLKVLGRAHGVVLEIGIGSGHNLQLFDPNLVTRVIGIDPSPELGRKAHERAARSAFPVELRPGTGEDASLERESVDTVVFTYTLCSVSSIAGVLATSRHALRPDGIVLFCEHALAPDAPVARWQRRLDPVWSALAGGCHLTRDTVGALRAAGFRVDELEQAYVPRAPRWIGFHQIGTARLAR
jgi:SAM-dependent methyltransferase